MKVFHQRPVPELRPFIDRIWGWESVSGEAVALPTLLPGTGAELYFHYRQPFRIAQPDAHPVSTGRGHLLCIRKVPVSLAPAEDLGFLAVRFRIGMLGRFTAIPAYELADRQLSAGDVWGLAGHRVTRQLAAADSFQDRLALVQRFLVRQLRPESDDLLVERTMSLLYGGRGPQSVDQLANMVGIGRRQLERRWTRFVGHGPGETRNLVRFQRTVRSLLLDPASKVLDKALIFGYFDQAHFIHDFRRRTGCTPQQYMRRARTATHFYNAPLRETGILTAPIE